MNEASKFRERWQRLGRWERYFVPGQTILDVGCGNDKIVDWATGWDVAQGDAQKLDGVANDSYDLVFSAHCIEHMRSPLEALTNWWRVVRPGGHLIVVGPDEDLYEQGIVPSVFNPDHKVTLTLHKYDSWSPLTINLIDLVRPLAGHKLVLAEIVDAGYDHTKQGVDQTLGTAEAGVELVVQKIDHQAWLRTALRSLARCPECGRLEVVVLGLEEDRRFRVRCQGCGMVVGIVL